VIGQACRARPWQIRAGCFPKWEFGIREEDMQKQVSERGRRGFDCRAALANGFDVDRKLAGRVKGLDSS
jgi:sulfur-oxidizing protein SoxB